MIYYNKLKIQSLDGSGFITEQELLQVMSKFRGGVTLAEIKNMINRCDKDSDVRINKNGIYIIL